MKLTISQNLNKDMIMITENKTTQNHLDSDEKKPKKPRVPKANMYVKPKPVSLLQGTKITHISQSQARIKAQLERQLN